MDDAILLHDGMGRLLLVQGVGFHLVYHGANLHELAQVHQTVGEEVGDPNGPDLPSLVGLFHGPPGAIVVVEGLVDEQQVNVVGLEFPQGFLNGGPGLFLPGVGDPDLGGKEDVFPGQAGAFDGPAHALLVVVGLGGVDGPIAHLKGLPHGGPSWARKRDWVRGLPSAAGATTRLSSSHIPAWRKDQLSTPPPPSISTWMPNSLFSFSRARA